MKTAGLAVLLAALQGCSVITYSHRLPTGEEYAVKGWSFIQDSEIKGFRLTSTKDEKSVGFDDVGRNQTNGVSAIVEGVVKGMAKAVAP